MAVHIGLANRIPNSAGLTGSVPVVILSSSSEEAEVARGYQGGADSYVVKNVYFAQFAEALSQLGRYRLLLHRVPQAGPVR